MLETLQFGETPDTSGDFSREVVSRHVTQQQLAQQESARRQAELRRSGARRLVRTVSAIAALALIAVFVTAWSSRRGGEQDGGRPRTAIAEAADSGASRHVQQNSAALPAMDVATLVAVPADYELYQDLFDIFEQSPLEAGDARTPHGQRRDAAMESGATASSIANADSLGTVEQHDQYAMLLDDWRMRLAEMPAEPLQVEQITGGLKPITEPFGVAFDLLRQTLPGENLPGQNLPVEKPQARRRPRLDNARFS
ncbi:MAG: hypothetical protein RIC55_17000 [Pirellulaceae bacterium]